MTKAEIITKFHLYMDDTTELSSQEEQDLFDKIYLQVMSDRPWEICRVPFNGTMSTTVPYIALPSDFAFLLENHNYTGNNSYGERPVIFVGTAYSPYEVVNYADRRQYLNKTGYAYIDIVNSRLVFTAQPTVAEPVEFDYCKVPASLLTTESPIFPARFHDIIYHGMCTDQYVIDQSDKAKSYRNENIARYNDYLGQMALWNANLQQI